MPPSVAGDNKIENNIFNFNCKPIFPYVQFIKKNYGVLQVHSIWNKITLLSNRTYRSPSMSERVVLSVASTGLIVGFTFDLALTSALELGGGTVTDVSVELPVMQNSNSEKFSKNTFQSCKRRDKEYEQIWQDYFYSCQTILWNATHKYCIFSRNTDHFFLVSKIVGTHINNINKQEDCDSPVLSWQCLTWELCSVKN